MQNLIKSISIEDVELLNKTRQMVRIIFYTCIQMNPKLKTPYDLVPTTNTGTITFDILWEAMIQVELPHAWRLAFRSKWLREN